MKTISIPVYNRPHYLRRMLESIKVQPEVKDYTLVFSLDPGCAEVMQMVRHVDWAPFILSANAVRRGQRLNTFLAIDTAFNVGSEFNVYAEDDYVFSPDALALADAFQSSEHSKKDLMLAFRRANQDLSASDTVRKTGSGDGLMGAGFCCRPHAFPVLSKWWLHYDSSFMWTNCWDVSIGCMIVKEGLTVWRPMVNRSQHIGQTGENTRPGTFDNPGLNGPCFSGRVDNFIFEE
jgi:hypothetical protein